MFTGGVFLNRIFEKYDQLCKIISPKNHGFSLLFCCLFKLSTIDDIADSEPSNFTLNLFEKYKSESTMYFGDDYNMILNTYRRNYFKGTLFAFVSGFYSNSMLSMLLMSVCDTPDNAYKNFRLYSVNCMEDIFGAYKHEILDGRTKKNISVNLTLYNLKLGNGNRRAPSASEFVNACHVYTFALLDQLRAVPILKLDRNIYYDVSIRGKYGKQFLYETHRLSILSERIYLEWARSIIDTDLLLVKKKPSRSFSRISCVSLRCGSFAHLIGLGKFVASCLENKDIIDKFYEGQFSEEPIDTIRELASVENMKWIYILNFIHTVFLFVGTRIYSNNPNMSRLMESERKRMLTYLYDPNWKNLHDNDESASIVRESAYSRENFEAILRLALGNLEKIIESIHNDTYDLYMASFKSDDDTETNLSLYSYGIRNKRVVIDAGQQWKPNIGLKIPPSSFETDVLLTDAVERKKDTTRQNMMSIIEVGGNKINYEDTLSGLKKAGYRPKTYDEKKMHPVIDNISFYPEKLMESIVQKYTSQDSDMKIVPVSLSESGPVDERHQLRSNNSSVDNNNNDSSNFSMENWNRFCNLIMITDAHNNPTIEPKVYLRFSLGDSLYHRLLLYRNWDSKNIIPIVTSGSSQKNSRDIRIEFDELKRKNDVTLDHVFDEYVAIRLLKDIRGEKEDPEEIIRKEMNKLIFRQLDYKNFVDLSNEVKVMEKMIWTELVDKWIFSEQNPYVLPNDSVIESFLYANDSAKLVAEKTGHLDTLIKFVRNDFKDDLPLPFANTERKKLMQRDELNVITPSFFALVPLFPFNDKIYDKGPNEMEQSDPHTIDEDEFRLDEYASLRQCIPYVLRIIGYFTPSRELMGISFENRLLFELDVVAKRQTIVENMYVTDGMAQEVIRKLEEKNKLNGKAPLSHPEFLMVIGVFKNAWGFSTNYLPFTTTTTGRRLYNFGEFIGKVAQLLRGES
jgi:hypothetical protein